MLAISVCSFRTGKKKAAAEGYEEGAELMYKMRTASAFIAANDPLVFLADASEIVIDEDWGTHRATDAEIKELVKDIKGMWRCKKKRGGGFVCASLCFHMLWLSVIYGGRTE